MTSPSTMQMTLGNQRRHPDTPEGIPWVSKPILAKRSGQGRRRVVGDDKSIFPFCASHMCDTHVRTQV